MVKYVFNLHLVSKGVTYIKGHRLPIHTKSHIQAAIFRIECFFQLGATRDLEVSNERKASDPESITNYPLVKGLISSEIADIEVNSSNEVFIADFEEIPIRMTPSVCIDSHE